MAGKKSKRVKMNCGYISKGLYTLIPDDEIIAENSYIRAHMEPIIQEHNRKDAESRNHASSLILNA